MSNVYIFIPKGSGPKNLISDCMGGSVEIEYENDKEIEQVIEKDVEDVYVIFREDDITTVHIKELGMDKHLTLEELCSSENLEETENMLCAAAGGSLFLYKEIWEKYGMGSD